MVERLLRIAEAGGLITTAPSGLRVVAILSMPRAISATYVPPEVHRSPQHELGVSRKRARTTQRGSPVAVEFGVSRKRARTTQWAGFLVYRLSFTLQVNKSAKFLRSPLAIAVERMLCTPWVTGSNPVGSFLLRLRFDATGAGFDSR